jgi:nitrite reductase/ring-hydroxylating ferredoxin subunit/uncharacterized membrane protein
MKALSRRKVRSKAQIRSHPLHPMLVPFPFVLLLSAAFADGIGLLRESLLAWSVGGWLAIAGVGTGLLAAVPGFIDYLYVVPPDSSGKRRATQHMLVNISAVALFGIAWLMRGAQPRLALWGLELLGAAAVCIGGWLGGTLVYRNQIGVDHRYAGAGKWREAAIRDAEPVPDVEDLEPHQMMLLRAGARRLVLARTEEKFCAFDDRCTHKGGSLAGGILACGVVTCPWHGSQFDARTGAVKSGPAEEPIRTYPVEQSSSAVRVRL